jgi:hypothetical protein
MYHSVIPVTDDHDPIVVEGNKRTQILIFNAGPSTIQAKVWNEWSGKTKGSYAENSDEPNLNLELRPGNQRIVQGSLIRLNTKDNNQFDKFQFAAVGIRVLNDIYYEELY